MTFTQSANSPPNVQFPYRLSMHVHLRSEAQQFFPGYSMGLGRFLVCPASRSRFELEDRSVGSGVPCYQQRQCLECRAVHSLHG